MPVDIEVASPCNQICEIEPMSGFCRGCGRTLDEIAEWPEAQSGRRLTILQALPQRLERLQSFGPTS